MGVTLSDTLTAKKSDQLLCHYVYTFKMDLHISMYVCMCDCGRMKKHINIHGFLPTFITSPNYIGKHTLIYIHIHVCLQMYIPICIH